MYHLVHAHTPCQFTFSGRAMWGLPSARKGLYTATDSGGCCDLSPDAPSAPGNAVLSCQPSVRIASIKKLPSPRVIPPSREARIQLITIRISCPLVQPWDSSERPFHPPPTQGLAETFAGLQYSSAAPSAQPFFISLPIIHVDLRSSP